HEVSSITSGTRFASFFWVQSLVRDDSKRHLLFNLDESIRALRKTHGDSYSEVMKLTNIYHNLIRMWSEL
ncbi:MAG: PKHD-type hydroxylase, partial [Acinetobacter calcoaceticus]